MCMRLRAVLTDIFSCLQHSFSRSDDDDEGFNATYASSRMSAEGTKLNRKLQLIDRSPYGTSIRAAVNETFTQLNTRYCYLLQLKVHASLDAKFILFGRKSSEWLFQETRCTLNETVICMN
jgi:hypothetical protein